jgi:hypothetical protein
MAAAAAVAAPPPGYAPAPLDANGNPIAPVDPGMSNPAGQPNDNLFVTYNPKGAAGGLFAPAYIHGYAPSEQAVADWQASKGGLTRDMIDELRMPEEWTPPSGKAPGDGVYGGSNIPLTLKLGQSGGLVDPAALRALSHGTFYDVGARRDAIAARLLANKQAQDAYGNPVPMERGQAYAESIGWHSPIDSQDYG